MYTNLLQINIISKQEREDTLQKSDKTWLDLIINLFILTSLKVQKLSKSQKVKARHVCSIEYKVIEYQHIYKNVAQYHKVYRNKVIENE